MSDNLGGNNNNYYGYYPSPEEGASGNEYQPQNTTEINGSLQVPHAVQPENGFQSWYNPMYMGHVYPRTSSEEGIYSGHISYMNSFSPPDNVVPPVVPSGVSMTPMMTPQSPQTPSPITLPNGSDHSPPTYYSPYRAIAAVGGAVEAPPGFQNEVDSTSHHNLSSETAHVAMQALSLNSSRGSAENGVPHSNRYDWQRRNFTSSEAHSGGTSDAVTNENVEIKQEAAEASWRPESNSPREEQETRENNWKAAGKTRTKDKYRVVYSDHQRVELEREFHFARYITIRRKTELAAQLGLSERQVKIWFQNRRAKERKQTKKREDKMESHMSYHNGQGLHSITNHHHHHHHHQHLSHSLGGPPPAHIPLTPFMMDVKPNLGLD